MIKPVALFCLVFVATVSCVYDEKLEDSFLPIDRENESDFLPVSPVKSFLNSHKDLLSKIKSISIIEFEKDDKDNSDKKKTFEVIDWTMDLENQNQETEHDIKKRAISHKYKSAALAFYGAIMKDDNTGYYTNRHKGAPRHRGKRSTSAFEKPSLFSYSYHKITPTSYSTRPQAPAVPQPQPTYSAPAPAVPQPQPTYSAPAYSSYNSFQSEGQPPMNLPNNCQVGVTEPIFQGVEVTETYCRCPTGTYGLNCQENFNNPCGQNSRQYHPADPSIGPHYFIECNWNTPYLFKCPANLVWNQAIETCDWQYNLAAPSSSSSSGYSAYSQPAY